MAEINQLTAAVLDSQKKIEKELKQFIGIYQNLSKAVGDAFKLELIEQDGKLTGLEDFYQLVNDIKKNDKIIKSTLSVFMQMKDISGFSITDFEEEKEAKEKEEKEKEKLKAVV